MNRLLHVIAQRLVHELMALDGRQAAESVIDDAGGEMHAVIPVDGNLCALQAGFDQLLDIFFSHDLGVTSSRFGASGAEVLVLGVEILEQLVDAAVLENRRER